jgi:hypothetical protein
MSAGVLIEVVYPLQGQDINTSIHGRRATQQGQINRAGEEKGVLDEARRSP